MNKILKVSLFNKRLLSIFGNWVAWIGTILSLFCLFFDIPVEYKQSIAIIFILVLSLLYLVLWIRSNYYSKRTLHINNSTVEIKIGDIFSDEDGLRAIAFNEYFDTLVDDKIISRNSLNGQFIDNYVKNIIELDEAISLDSSLLEQQIELNTNRATGKQQKYKLGAIFPYQMKDQVFLLTSLTHFDAYNRAYLSMPDYLNFLISFWDSVDKVYAGRSIIIPLFGSGITRFTKGYDDAQDQELLDIIIWTFKISRIKFTYPAKLIILISKDKQHKINFFNI